MLQETGHPTEIPGKLPAIFTRYGDIVLVVKSARYATSILGSEKDRAELELNWTNPLLRTTEVSNDTVRTFLL